jgi:hypothetical protein
MRVLVLATVAFAATSHAAPPVPGPAASAPEAVRVLPGGRITGRECRDRFQVIPADARTPSRPRVLTELPPGDTILAVYKEVDGCMEPLIVRYGDGRRLGAGSAPASQAPRHR